jgi:serine/threonine protein kinase
MNQQIPKTFIFILILSISPTSGKYIKELKNCLTEFTDIEELYEKEKLTRNANKATRKDPNSSLEHYADIKNMDNLASAILSGNNLRGAGSYGKVYKTTGVSFDSPEIAKDYGVKVIKFGSDYEYGEEEKQQQQGLATEINMTKEFNALDEENLFFPRLYKAYQADSFFMSQYSQCEGHKNENLLYVGSGREVAVLFMEFLSISLHGYFKQCQQYSLNTLFINRLRIFFNLGFGLLKIANNYNHCDIKPDNIMFKKITEAESLSLQEQGLEPLELTPNKFFQLQIIDYGMVVKGKPNKRRCTGGSPGYIPLEFFEKSETHEKFDLYSSVVMVVMSELLDLGFRKFEYVVGLGYKFVKSLKTKKSASMRLSTEYLNALNSINLMNLGKTLWESSTYSLFLIESIQKYFKKPLISQILKSHSKTKIEELTFEKIYNHNGNALIPLAYAIVETLYNYYYIPELLPKKIEEYNNEKAIYEQKASEIDNESEEFQQNQDMIRYYEAKITLENNEAEMKIRLINQMLIVLANPPKTRPTMSDTFGFIESLIEETGQNNWAQYSLITMTARSYKILQNKIPKNIPDYSLEKQMSMQMKLNDTGKMIRPDFRVLI